MEDIVLPILLFLLAVAAYCAYVVFIGPLLAALGAVVMFGHVAAGTVVGLGQAAATARTVPEREGDDPAFVSYFFGQDLSDLVWSARSIVRGIGDVSEWFTDIHDETFDDIWQFSWPVILGHLVGGIVGLLVVGAALLVLAVAVVIGRLVAWTCCALLRGADWVLRIVRGVRTRCPHAGCNNPISYPGYRCPRCDAVHLDVRPGRYGVAVRTCRCGHKMPTLVLLGSARGQATCPHCLRPLEKSAGTLREIQVPVLGAASAGKSGFLGATFNALDGDETGRVTEVRPADPSRPLVEELASRAAAGMVFDPTGRHVPAAMQLYIQPAKGRQIAVHFFDPAGELLRGEEETMDQLGFLGHADRFVFVLDPLALPSVVEQLDPEDLARAESAGPTREDQEQTFHNSVQRAAGRIKKGRLAFVVTKVDVLQGTRAAEGLDGNDSDAVAAWLDRHELGNLVRAARNGFAETRFYACSAVDAAGGPTAAALIEPVSWLLDLKAAPEPAPATAGAST